MGKKRLPLPDEITSPLLSAVRTGFHSVVEVVAAAVSDAEDLDRALHEAVHMRRLDLIELLHQAGACPERVSYGCIIACNQTPIVCWFENHGVDLETDLPLAAALRDRERGALGTLMRWKERKPQLMHQANMALRYHTRRRDLKWVSLLLWAGADPREIVPSLERRYPFDGTALADAVSDGQMEIIRKFKIDPARDDVTVLFGETAFRPNLRLTQQCSSLVSPVNQPIFIPHTSDQKFSLSRISLCLVRSPQFSTGK